MSEMCPLGDETLNCMVFYPGILDAISPDLRKDIISLLHQLSQIESKVENALERSEALVVVVEKELGPQHYVCEAVVKELVESLRRKCMLEDAVDFIQKRSERIKTEDFGCLMMLGALYQNAGEYHKAMEPCKEALQLAKKLENPLLLSLAQVKQACYLWHGQEPEEAKEQFRQSKESLNTCPEISSDISLPFTQETVRLLDIYKTLAYFHRLLGERSKAAEYCIKAYNIIKKDEKALVQAFKLETQLAAEYSQSRENHTAEMYSLSAYQKIKEVAKSPDYMMHHVLNVVHSLSRVTHALQTFEKSDRVLGMREELYDIGKKYLGEHHPETIRIAADTAYLCMNMKNRPKQNQYLSIAESSLKDGIKSFDDSKVQLYVREIGDAWKSLGLTYMQLQQFPDAERCYKEAVVINTSVYGGNHPRLSRLYRSLGILYRKTKQYTQALEYFQKAKGISDEFYPGDYQLRMKLEAEIKTVKNPGRKF